MFWDAMNKGIQYHCAAYVYVHTKYSFDTLATATIIRYNNPDNACTATIYSGDDVIVYSP